MSDIRELFATALDALAESNPEAVTAFVQEAFKLEREKEVTTTIACKHCQKEGRYTVTVAVPDYRERAKAIQILTDQAKGKPPETKRVELGAHGILKNISEMSDLELAEEIARGRMPTDVQAMPLNDRNRQAQALTDGVPRPGRP